MSDELKRTVTSAPDAAIRESRIELPDYLQRAISESLERGKRVAREESVKSAEKQEKSVPP
jgi:hypothetical protein